MRSWHSISTVRCPATRMPATSWRRCAPYSPSARRASLRREARVEAVYAEEAGEVGHQTLVPLRGPHRLLLGIYCPHGRSSGGRRQHGPRLQGGDEVDASPSAVIPPPVRRQLYFTSVHLAIDLLHADKYLCGTTRATRREFPRTLAAVRLQRGESVKWTNGDGVMLVKWHDKRDVHMIATNDAGEDFVRATRRKRQIEDVTVPVCVGAYNQHMGGVDRLHQLRSYYGVGRGASSTPTSCGRPRTAPCRRTLDSLL